MSQYFLIEPEVAGGFGDNTLGDLRARPPKVSKLHYEFEGWPGDHLLETISTFVITKELAEKLVAQRFSGFELAPVEITTSEGFDELYSQRKLPPFEWLKVTGKPGQDDFGLAMDEGILVVSQSALDVILPFCRMFYS